MDYQLFYDMLRIDSCTKEGQRKMADFLAEVLTLDGAKIQRIPEDAMPEQPVNILASWGGPKITYCSHLDTVPPYIPYRIEGEPDTPIAIHGRGTCDAKGQVFSMIEACRALRAEGATDFALLIVYGEETGSFGAKMMNTYPGTEYLVVGEPTDCRMTTAAKGTKSFKVAIKGKACHSGYPHNGVSAVERFVDMMEHLRATQWPKDDILGDTTYNIGELQSHNPQNILSSLLSFRIYFRTTFASDDFVCNIMEGFANEYTEIQAFGGDTPSRFFTLPGFETSTVAFGSDAPQLKNYAHKMLYGPGSINVAHTDKEYITVAELEKAVDDYKQMYRLINK